MEIRAMQETIDGWIREHGGYWDDLAILARMTEELGEVASALQRAKGLRPRLEETDLPGEVGDLLFILVCFANRMGIDLEEEIGRVIEKYTARDGDAWKRMSDPKRE